MSTTHRPAKYAGPVIAEGQTRGIRWSVQHITEARGHPADYYRVIVSGEAVALGSLARFDAAEAEAAAVRIAEHDAADRDASDRATATRIARSAGVA